MDLINYHSLDEHSDETVLQLERGTIVRLSKTDRISNRDSSTFANTLRRKIGQTFRKFLKSGLTIEVNGKWPNLKTR